jgi:hypothetical protein
MTAPPHGRRTLLDVDGVMVVFENVIKNGISFNKKIAEKLKD